MSSYVRHAAHAVFTQLPFPLKRTLRRAYWYGTMYYCPVCESHVRSFCNAGAVHNRPRPNAVCPICSSYERHRLMWVFIKRKTTLLDGKRKKLLHFAPEAEIERLFRSEPSLDYTTADMYSPHVDVSLDIMHISYPDASFDAVICSHVLEHISDDRRAIAEIFRILKPGGFAIIMVPITDFETFEDTTITDPKAREYYFGQSDHVRRYGDDFLERLQRADVDVRVFEAEEIVDSENIERFGVRTHERVIEPFLRNIHSLDRVYYVIKR